MNIQRCLRTFLRLSHLRLNSISITQLPARHPLQRFTLQNTRCLTLKSFKVLDRDFQRNYENSFQNWILNFFKNNENHPTYEVSAPLHPPGDDLTNLDLKALLCELWAKKSEEALTPLILRKFDVEISSRLTHKCSSEELLGCLHALMETVPIQGAKLNAFNTAILQLEIHVKKNKLSPHELVQAMYYSSHLKSGFIAKNFMKTVLFKLNKDKLNKLCTTDLGIFCVSLFRSAVPLEQQPLLQLLEERFKSDANSLIKNNPAIFISFIKCFRLSKYHEPNTLAFVAAQGEALLSTLDMVGRIHLGVYFAAAQYGDKCFVESYLKKTVEQVSTFIRNRTTPRLKDIDNLLWSCAAYYSTSLNSALRDSEIPKYVRESLGLLRNNVHMQISLLLWLWMCECRLEREVERYVTIQNIKFIKDSKHYKSLYNVQLLITCVQIEVPSLLKPQVVSTRDYYSMQPRLDSYMKKRPQLKELLNNVKKNSDFLQLGNVRFAFQVPALYIGGIQAEYKGKQISIEVVDESVCLSNSDLFIGRMCLKLRLLKAMRVPYLEVKGASSYDMEHLRNELISLNCDADKS